MRERPRLTRQTAFVSLAAAAVGAAVGVLAGAFRRAAEGLLGALGSLSAEVAHRPVIAWLVPALAAAALATVALWIVRRFAPESGGSGVQEIEGALDGTRPLRWWRVIPAKFAGATLALGSGMALGREGPTVQIGGSVGAMTSDMFGLSSDNRHVLIAAGAAAGLAAAFNAPLAGVVFIIEEMRPQFRFGFLSFQSVLIASVTADLVTRATLGQGPVIRTADFVAPALGNLPLFLLFGTLLGAVAVVFAHSLVAVLDRADELTPRGRLLATALVGAAVGIAGAVDSGLVGGGYGVIASALTVQRTVGALLLLFALRFVLTLASYGSGVPGGIFAPMLALGTLLGIAFEQLLSNFGPGLVASPGIFAVAGMAAFFSATVRAPITGIVLTIEMTGGLSLVLTLLVTCLAATFASEALGARPIYEVLLDRTIRRQTTEEGTGAG